MPPPSLRWSDAWIMHAIGLATSGGRPSLVHIIGAADFTQHAVPTKEELDGAFARLSRAGLIGVDAEGASLTQAGQYVFAAAQSGARGVRDELATLADRIGAGQWRPGENPRQARGNEPECITQSAYESAVSTYLGQTPGGGGRPPGAR